MIKHCKLARTGTTGLLIFLFATSVFGQSTTGRYKMSTDIPASITTPDKVETSIGTLRFTDGFPDQETVTKVYNNLDLQNGTQAFLNGLPLVSIEGVRRALASFGPVNQTALITEQ